MSFGFWADELMTQPLGARWTNQARLLGLTFGSADKSRDVVVYFGSTDKTVKLQTKQDAGVAAITLTPSNALAVRANNTTYQVGDYVVASLDDAFLYRCTTGGISGTVTPNWVATVGSNTADGAVVWRCVARRERAIDVKLALSAAALDSAVGGAALALGTELRGGVAVAVHLRVSSVLKNDYQALALPQVSLQINGCESVAVE